MKILSAIWPVLLLSLTAFSQDSITIRNKLQEYKEQKTHIYSTVYKTNPMRVFWGPIPLTAEYRIVNETVTDNNQSFLIGVSYLGKSLLYAMIEDSLNPPNQRKIQISGYRVQAAYKFYLSSYEFAPSGFYIAPHISYSTAKFTNKGLSRNGIYIRVTNYNMSILTGFQVIAKSGFVIDFFSGIGYKKYTWVEHLSPTRKIIKNVGEELGPLYQLPIIISIGFNMGIAF